MMKKWLVTALLMAAALGTWAETGRTPALQVEEAIQRARAFVQEKKLDLGRSFIGRVEYRSPARAGAKACWQVTWMSAAGSLKGATFVNVYEDGSVTVAAE